MRKRQKNPLNSVKNVYFPEERKKKVTVNKMIISNTLKQSCPDPSSAEVLYQVSKTKEVPF